MKLIGDIGQTLQMNTAAMQNSISDILQIPITTLTPVQQRMINEIGVRIGKSPDAVVQILSEMVFQETEVDSIQTLADSCNAEAETSGIAEEPPIVEVDGMANDDDWEDEDLRSDGHLPRLFPRPPPSDGFGNKFITVVHSNGFHSLPIVWCHCPGSDCDRDLQLLDLHLYPASYKNVKTVFTFSCLDDHRCENLECKSSHYQYYSKLRRMTCPEYPEASPKRYAELCRVARQWRNLKYRKWFGIWSDEKPERGQMAIFCAACPQDGVNLPPDWKADQEANP
jgi:hypothetical protein